MKLYFYRQDEAKYRTNDNTTTSQVLCYSLVALPGEEEF